MSLRERQSAARRQKMLDAAEALIRQTGGTEFSMRALADAAEVSPATPYNIFGSKEGLLFALLERSLEVFRQKALLFSARDPFEQAIEAVEKAVGLLLADPAMMRPLYQVMLGLSDPIHHPDFIRRAFDFYRRALGGLRAEGVLPTDEDLEILALSMMSHIIGLLNLWVHEDIRDGYFKAQAILGVIQLLWPLARGAHVAVLERKHRQISSALLAPALRPSLFNEV
ncbi:MAG TPA: TetR/AcrR family transcriptional regulator [Methylibium sp.]|nr:TetR/AcrR family transcriptional regulator [Methylibium sp.]